MKRIALFLVMSTVFFAPVLRAQFGNINQKLKEKAQELLKEGQEEAKEKLVEEADKKRASFDTTSFMYAIAFLDKTEPFADKQKGESLMKTAHFVIKDEEDKSIAEQARDLYELGRINYSARRYFLAETSLKAALGLYAIGNDDTDPVYLKTLGTLGLLYSDMGRYDKAAEHTTLALEGWERSMGKESSGYAAEFNNKGVLLLNQADYNQAEKQMRAAIGLIRQKEGENSVPFAIALNNLGILFQYMGRSDEALRQLDRCLEISEELLRDKSSTYLQLLTNKALVLQENGKYGEAEAIYKQALDLQVSRMKVNRKSDPDYAHMLTNLASLYVRTGRSDEAGELFAESLAIYKGKFGVSHPLTASAQSDLGNWYRFEGRYEEALPLLSTSLATRISVFGENHPHTIQSREDLAIVYWKKGEINKADELFDLVMDHSLSFINEFFPPMSEAEKTKYWEKLKPRFFTYFNFAFSQNSPSLLAKALDYRLATKGLLLSSTTRIKNAILSGSDAALVALYTTWQDQKRMLASFYSLSREEVEQQNLNIDSLERAANESERMLSQRSSQFASAFVAKDRTFHQVNNALLAGQAVVEIIQYPFFENSLTDEHRYAALIIQKNGPELVIMENGNQLETRYYSYFKNAIGQKIADKYSYDQYWAKIGTKLQGAGTVFVSPDGVYNQVNLNAFRMADGGFLVQQKDIRIIGNPYDLVESRKVSSGAKSAFLLGYPTYGNGEIVPLP
ncbi:MAG: CHAT domain-containing protein, partial [Cyclobacteriaceae bacterium]|nr:CHAT domain-containing protein [Cyclobacteriaceae bacterium]